MPISRSPFPFPRATRDVQHYLPTMSQPRNQLDIRIQNNTLSNQEVGSSKQDPYIYPEHDPLE